MEPALIVDFCVDDCPEAKSEGVQVFRDAMHKELDKFLDKLTGVLEKDERPRVADLSDLVTQCRQEFLGSCLQHIIEQRYSVELNMEASQCPRCGKTCTHRQMVRKNLETTQGPFRLTRPWFYCTTCKQGFAPLDAAAEISRREKQFDIQKRAVKLAAQVPFACASEIYEDLTGQKASDHFIHDVFEEVGEHAPLETVIPKPEEIAGRIESVSTGKWRPILVVASDGAHLPTRPKAKRDAKRGAGQYKEAKGFRIYLVSKKRIVHVASWHQIQNEEQFGADLALAASRIPRDKVRVALLGDGADWLWKHMTACFPGGREVLDFYHCSQHLYEVAKAQYGEKSSAGFEWVEATLCRLFYGEVGHTIAGLRRMKPRTPNAEELIRKLIGYLNKNRKRFNYRSLRLGGFPIGSGGIESANKFICHTRMKRSGAWWVKVNGNSMLRIRCAVYNGTYDDVFKRYTEASLPKLGTIPPQ